MAYTTLADVKLYLGIETTEDDSLLSSIIPYAQSNIELYTSRKFEGTEETRYYDESYIYDDYLNIRGDLYSLTSITNGEGATIEVITYPINNPPYYSIKLKKGYDWRVGNDKLVTVTGIFAYSNIPPSDIVLATIRMVGYIYHLKDSQIFDVTAMPEQGVIQIPKGIPKDVQIILDRYQRYVTY